MNAHILFPEPDRTRIAEAIGRAEARTSGEIVTMVVGRSWEYPRAEIMGAVFLTLLATLLLSLVLPLNTVPRTIATELLWFLVFRLLLRNIPPLKRLFVQKDFRRDCVRQRAIRAFHEHGLDRTKESNGVLIMISLFERDVEILADRGIDSRVPRGAWDEIVQNIVKGIREQKAPAALVDAIERVGDILEKEFPINPGDVNELRDHLIVED